MKKYCIGIDIGGTHTDGVLIDSQQTIVSSCKVTTTENPADGVSLLINKICSPLNNDFSQIGAVHIGTTHPTNAILEARGLARVGIIRIAPDELIVAPGASWPSHIRSAVAPKHVTIRGGYECTGKANRIPARSVIQEAIKAFLDDGVEAIAIVGVFAPLVADQEHYIRDIVHDCAPHIPVTCSSDIGGIGFVDRENGTIINAALSIAITHTLGKIAHHIADCGIHAPIRISQNDGTLMDCATALRFPVRMISAGPTNSAVGAAQRAGLDHCVIADIGGTSTDVVVVRGGVPRKSYKNSSIGGISLNARMPDVVSIALGGGSIVDDGRIGPTSVARALKLKSEAFGGSYTTLTDCAIKVGTLTLDGADAARVSINSIRAEEYLITAARSLERAIKTLRGAHTIPAVLVGGGSFLFSQDFFTEPVIIPSHASVANAIGAACGKISATVDIVVSLDNKDPLSAIRAQVYEKAERAGADPKTISIVDEVVLPYAYTEGNMARVMIMATGECIWK